MGLQGLNSNMLPTRPNAGHELVTMTTRLPRPNKSRVDDYREAQWPSGSVSHFRTTGPRFKPRAGQATRGLLATDYVVLNHCQVTWTTPDLVPLSPNYNSTPTGRPFSLDRFIVHRCPTRRVSRGTGLELVTRPATLRYLYHSATTAHEN
ncbi:uncharacterized protein TNCV_4294181 [Trichonephila clavipes]|uniref:Uncharacterized protein n=1 Tax=Trichonephila clavipes TaxID=2585209 RepID=A0A8X6RG46_TRICX|nr:uncharacterized protein TNCV_4294181 [Trichonephila clavipes]